MPMSSPDPLFLKIDCYSVPVPDLDQALAFYSDRLGHELIWRSKTAAGLRLPESNAELVLSAENRPAETDLQVADVRAAVQRFRQAGGEIVAGPFEIQIGLCAVVKDPWGNHLVLLDTSKGLLKTDENGNVTGNLGADSILPAEI
ncbi:MAG: VOC family protein [Chloroflexi bacterium]|nr:VOC family protein [Chloroflexota bacterium]MCL5274748.1 VOC family protein [Chloroflexota bacterium]